MAEPLLDINYYVTTIRETWWRSFKRPRLWFLGLLAHSFICSLNKHSLRANSTLFQKIKGRFKYIGTQEELSDLLEEIIRSFFLALTASKGHQVTEMAKTAMNGAGTSEERHPRKHVFSAAWI